MLASLWRGSLYKRVLASLIFLNIFGLLAWGIVAEFHKYTKSGQGVLNSRTEKMFVHDGIMSSVEVSHFNSLYAQLSQGRDFSDADISWLMTLTTLPSQSNVNATSQAFRHDCALELFDAYLKTGHATPAQKNSIFNAASPLLASKDPIGLDAVSASHVLRTLNDKRAIPLLVPLVNSPNSHVRASAIKSLKLMGYNTGTYIGSRCPFQERKQNGY